MTDIQKETSRKGKLIVVASSNGGSGKSSIASNLGVSLAQNGHKTVVLDNNFYFSDMHVFFDKKYKHNISGIFENYADIDEKTIELYLTQYNMKNLYVIPGTNTPEDGEQIEDEKYLKVINHLTFAADYIIVDLVNGFSDLNLSLLDMCHHMIIISNSNLNTVLNTKKYVDIVEQLNLTCELHLIINKYSKNKNLSQKQIETLLDHEGLMYIKNEEKLMAKAINIGIPAIILNKASAYSKKINELGKRVTAFSIGGE